MTQRWSSLERKLAEGLSDVVHGGVALAVVQGERSGVLTLAPTTDWTGMERPGPDEPFHACSCSKSFLAACLTSLVEDGVLSWDLPIRDVVPEFDPVTARAASGGTLLDVAAMRTGLSRDGVAEWGFDQTRPKSDRVARSREMRTVAPWGERFCYSNLGYIALGLGVERVTGRCLDDLLRERVFAPLGMTASWSAGFDCVPRGRARSPAVLLDGSATPVEDLTGPNSEGSARVHLSAEDATKWLRFLLDTLGSHGNAPGSSALRELGAAQTPIRDAERRWQLDGDKCAYGLGLFVSSFAGGRLFHHGGGGRGLRHQMLVAPWADTALMLMASAETAHADGLALDLLEHLLGLEPREWAVRLAKEAEAVAAKQCRAICDRFAALGAAAQGRPLPCGMYWNPVTGRVELRESELGIQFVPEDAPALAAIALPAADGSFDLTFEHPALWPQPLDSPYKLALRNDRPVTSLEATYFGVLERCE